MKSTFKLIFIAIFATVSFGALAADWTVTQEATIGGAAAPDLKQGNATNVSNSEQAINGIALKTDEDSLAGGSSQLATLTSTSLNLTQGDLVGGSSQAINYLEGQNVGTVGGVAVTQTVASTSTATILQQEVAIGSGNVQALNIGKASDTGTINKLNQVVTEGGTLSLIQNDVETAQNVQAVNYAFGQTIGVSGAVGGDKLEQATTVTGATSFNQGSDVIGGNNRQGGNIAVTSASGTGVVAASQTFTASAVIGLTQSVTGGGGNVQALNQVDTTANNAGANVGTVDQTFINAAGSTGTTFTSTAGSGSNVQAANLVDTGGSITALIQTFTASGSPTVEFDMTGGGAGNIQAGNMARTDNNAIIEAITQTFTGSLVVNTFNQNSSGDNLVQSGNLIALGTGVLLDTSGPHQVFATGTGSITMTQQGGGTDNLQSLNAITKKAGGTGATTQAHQTITTEGAFTMSQNAMTTSGQYGNFAGEEL